MAVSQAEFLKRYEQGIAGAGEKYKVGVQTGEDWEARYSAPESQTAMREGLARAIAEGKPTEGARRIGTAGYRARTVEKAPNYTGSATRAKDNITAHVPQILAAGEAAKAAARAVTGPKTRATAKAKQAAALDAIMDAWHKP